jgi:hypothetical protein
MKLARLKKSKPLTRDQKARLHSQQIIAGAFLRTVASAAKSTNNKPAPPTIDV